MKNIIEITDLRKNYQGKEVLKGIDLTIRQGEIFVLLGKNGAGKSTMFKILTGLTEPLAGTVKLFGQNSSQESRYRIGFNINEPVFYEHLSARENLLIHCEYLSHSPEKLEHWLTLMGLTGDNPTPVKQYSLGMRQRLALARCLVHDPELIIIDEPLNGLDPKGIKQFRGLLERISSEGKTIVMSSHILAEVEAIATRIAVITDGEIVLDESKEQLKQRLTDTFEDYLIDQMEGEF